MTIEMRNDGSIDQFPVGMRVLAVDDDPICLRLLETLLRKCQYHVTTKDRAIDALELLRENKDKFDLVISDVHMPDMDGFKLLELMGLEMDLPVIMLSANGDPKMVMKGITHGACDYLLKPVRLEELKNIWQHVIRKKKVVKKDQSDSDKREKRSCPADGQKCSAVGDSDQDGRNCKRRKDQSEDDDDEETDENGHEDDDPSSQKKARVVWSVELHRKFVAAVNQLGFDRAMPKKILDLMNVEKLTRENVASHLQKYRLYLKRLSSVANQQANMVAALGGADSAYLQMNPMNFHNFNGSGPFQNNALRSFLPAGMLGRLNSPAGLSIHGLSPSGIAPLGHVQKTQSPITDSIKFQLPRDHQTGNILQGMPTSLEFDQLQIPLKKGVVGVAGEFSSTNEGSGRFSVSGGMLDGKNVVNGPCSNPVLTLPNNSLLLQDHSQEIRRQGSLGNQASVAPVQFRPDSGFGVMGSNRINGNWPRNVQSSGVQLTSFESNDGYPQPPLVQAYNPGNSVSSSALNGASELHIPSNIPRFDTRCQGAVLCNDGAQNMGYSSKPLWSDHKLATIHHPDYMNSSMNPSMVSQGACSSTPVGNPTGVYYSGSNDLGFTGHPSMDSSNTHHTRVGVSGMDLTTNLGAFTVNGAGSLEDVVTSMNKWEQEGAAVNKSSDLGSYPLRTCI